MDFNIYIKRFLESTLHKENPVILKDDLIKVYFDNIGFYNGTDSYKYPKFVIGDGSTHFNDLPQLDNIIIKHDTVLKSYPDENKKFTTVIHFDSSLNDPIDNAITYNDLEIKEKEKTEKIKKEAIDNLKKKK